MPTLPGYLVEKFARTTTGRPPTAISRVGIAHHRAITTASVSDPDPAQAIG